MKRALLPLLLLAGCVTTEPMPTPAPAVATRPEPGPRLRAHQSHPDRLVAAAPRGCKVDPKQVTIPPLALTVKKPNKRQLPNGLTIYTLEDHAAPLVNVRAR